MGKVELSASERDIVCAETPGGPCGLVVFGASGDLVRRKLIPSLFELFGRGLLSERFYFLGCGRKDYSDDQFRAVAREALRGCDDCADRVEEFLRRFYFLSGSYTSPEFYDGIGKRLVELDAEYNLRRCNIFYLAVPPVLYGSIAENLGRSGLSSREMSECEGQPRLIIEKPFGRDLESAFALNAILLEHFDESQIYRIDHYLGKETVQNILMMRFANAIFEPVWNRNYIDHVQITIAESLGVESRAGYYDKSGALRDMFQNHMLGMLSLMAMEAPALFDADQIRNEKVKLLRAIRPLVDEGGSCCENVVRGQYVTGDVNGRDVGAYAEAEGVAAESETETFVAAKVLVDNWRWHDVPFYLRTGKSLSRKATEIAITFKHVPHSMFASVGLSSLPANVLVLKIQPDEGVELSFQAKRPGSKACLGTLNMNFNYSDVFDAAAPEAYQRLLLDCMVGDQTLFTRQDEVEISWGLMDPVLKSWERGDCKLFKYVAGSASFARADELIEADGRSWREI